MPREREPRTTAVAAATIEKVVRPRHSSLTPFPLASGEGVPPLPAVRLPTDRLDRLRRNVSLEAAAGTHTDDGVPARRCHLASRTLPAAPARTCFSARWCDTQPLPSAQWPNQDHLRNSAVER